MAFKTKEELERLREDERMQKGDARNELQGKLSKTERLARIFSTCEGVWSLYRITDWEKNFLKSLKENGFQTLTERQDVKLRQIEDKIVDQELREAGREDKDEDDFPELDGRLKFKG